MPTPFICRKCTARLAKSVFRSLRLSQSPLHTRTIPSGRLSYVLGPLAEHDLEHPQSRRPEVAPKGNSSNNPTAPPSHEASSQGKHDGADEIMVYWQGEIGKFVPRRTPAVKQLATLPTNSLRELKAKIIAARGDYVLFHGDLASLCGLSDREARHAVGQLERLLWGHLEIEVTARRLDQYLAWKKDFSATLKTVIAALSVQGGKSAKNAGVSKMALYESEMASMRTAWQRLPRERRERLWPQMMLSAAKSEAHILLTLINSTFDPSWCPSYVLEDVLYLLYCRQLALNKDARNNRGQIQQVIEAMTAFILDECPPRYLALEQAVLVSTFSPLSTPELIERYKLLKTLEHPFHANTLLHLASRFAKGYDTKLHAADIIRILTDMPRFDLNTPAAASVCTTLLTINEHDPLPDPQVAPDLLFEFLLNRGLRPNLLGLSALMRNFCLRGHLDTAWKIFYLMLQYGLEPDQHVYSILLNGSKQNFDSVSFEQIFSIITSRSAWSPVLLNDFLGLLFRENELQPERRRRQRKKANNAWRPMLELYAKFYDLAPLQKFTLFSLDNLVGARSLHPNYSTPSIRLAAESLPPQPENRLMQPDTITLSLMIGAHMRSLLTPKYAIRYYKCFVNLVNRQDPTALSLLENHRTLIFDIYLRTLMQFRETTGFAMKELLKKIRAADKERKYHGRNRLHHPPSVHTWTIALNGLKNHNDTRGAVDILDMMTNIGGMQPNLATWNALIQAFARTRNVGGAVKAVWSLEKAGFQPDDRTINAFSMLPRKLREHAIAQLEELRKAPGSFPNAKAPPDSVTSPAVPTTKGTLQSSSNGPNQRSNPAIPKTFRAPARQGEKLDTQAIDSQSKRRRTLREPHVSTLNSHLPVGALARLQGKTYLNVESPSPYRKIST